MRSLPGRLRLVVGFALVLVAGALMQRADYGESLDRWLLDRAFSVLRRYHPQPVPADVALIGIDERSFARYPEPFVLWHRNLGRLMKALAIARPSAVGFDLALPERSYDALLPGYDQALIDGLRTLRAVSPIVLVRKLDEYGNFRAIHHENDPARWEAANGGTARRLGRKHN